jgi:hypothetical protein
VHGVVSKHIKQQIVGAYEAPTLLPYSWVVGALPALTNCEFLLVVADEYASQGLDHAADAGA